MKKYVRIFTIALLTAAAILLAYFVGTGMLVKNDVYLGEYYVSEDGKSLTFTVGVASSMGFVRTFRDKGGGVKPHYLTFYSCFGGLNSSFGTKTSFVLPTEANDTEIYFNRRRAGYELVLRKNADGIWEKP